MRLIVLSTIIVGALATIPWAQPVAPAAAPLLTYVTTAHQLGVVGYRDPAGAISPDGKRFAYSEGRFVRVVPIGGGAPLTLTPGEGQIRNLLWTSNSHIVIEDITPSGRWWLHEVGKVNGTRLGRLGTQGLNSDARQLACATNGEGCTALRFTSSGAELIPLGGDLVISPLRRIEGRVSWPAIRPHRGTACIVNARIMLSCGGDPLKLDVDRDVYGPIAFSPDGNTVYFSSPNAAGMVELWAGDVVTRRARRLSNFNRDAYGPSVSADGTVVFKVQSYRTHLADVSVDGGITRQLTTFQSETPSYHPKQSLLAFTYGSWRRVVDDAKYPDIAQDIGVIDVSKPLPANAPASVIAKSESEDQAMAWSPNGKWIAFHTHREMSDDVWLRPSDGSQPDKRITFLGRGAEVGWPRWSPDGNRVLVEGARNSDGRSVLYTIGVDQHTGAVTTELAEIRATGFDGEMGHAEWLGNDQVIAVAKEAPGRHAILTLPVAGGTPRFVHRYETEHDFSGLGVSPDGRFAAFAAPAADGYYQIFKIAIAGVGAAAVQVTADRSHKTQPAWSPDGERIAFTVWSYDATFWSFSPR